MLKKRKNRKKFKKSLGFKKHSLDLLDIFIHWIIEQVVLAQHIALKKIDPPFIILEDDATPSNFTPEIEVPDDADAVYLGVSSWEE